MNDLFNFKKYGDNVALVSNETEITYLELEQLTFELSSFIKKRALVFLICTNSIEAIIAYISIIKSGAVCLLINDNNLEELFIKYKPEYVVLPKVKEFNANIITDIGEYILYKTNFDIDYKVDDELAILLTTSGSTGSPKFVRLSYENIISNTNSISEYLKITHRDRAITTMPMNYSYGLSIINTHLANGASVVLTEFSIMSRDFWSLLKDKSVTNFGGVPYIYEMLKKLRFENIDLPSLKYITQAGGKLNTNLILDFYQICNKKSIKFFVMYGQTEATARLSYLPPSSLPQKAGSIGIAIPNGKFVIKDENGSIIEDSEVSGELVYFGKNVSLGYSQNCYDLNSGDINRGCLDTGDLAKRDNDGYYYIVGRKKRFVKIYGNRVNLDEFEQIIKNYGYECACGGQDDKLVIYLTDRRIDKNELLNNLMFKTGLNKNAFGVVYINELPRNESGKTLYYELEHLEGNNYVV